MIRKKGRVAFFSKKKKECLAMKGHQFFSPGSINHVVFGAVCVNLAIFASVLIFISF